MLLTLARCHRLSWFVSNAPTPPAPITGLLINFVHHYWPSLLKIDGFLQEFITPIVKVSKGAASHKTCRATPSPQLLRFFSSTHTRSFFTTNSRSYCR